MSNKELEDLVEEYHNVIREIHKLIDKEEETGELNPETNEKIDRMYEILKELASIGEERSISILL